MPTLDLGILRDSIARKNLGNRLFCSRLASLDRSIIRIEHPVLMDIIRIFQFEDQYSAVPIFLAAPQHSQQTQRRQQRHDLCGCPGIVVLIIMHLQYSTMGQNGNFPRVFP